MSAQIRRLAGIAARWLPKWAAAAQVTFDKESPRLDQLTEIASLWTACTSYLVGQGLSGTEPEPALECQIIAFESLMLGIHCCYQSATIVLRRQLELAAMSAWFARDPTAARHYMSGTRTAPFRKLLSRVCDSANALELGRIPGHDLGQYVSFRDIYGLWQQPLSGTVHAVFGTWSLLDWDFSPGPTFSANAFGQWADLFEVCQRTSLVWTLISHPGMIAALDRLGAPEWQTLFGKDDLNALAAVADLAGA